MKKKLDTRFPAARIKKIMQADEEVGKIALATPVLISKALELFLQNLCDKTYEITLKRGAKTMSALHLKQCVQTNSVFDFLQEIVSKVPDIATDANGEEKHGGRRRKASDVDDNESEEEEQKRPKLEVQPAAGRGRCRGRGRGRGRTKNNAAAEKSEEADLDTFVQEKVEKHAETSVVKTEECDVKEVNEARVSESSKSQPRNFDLNMDLDENGEVAPAPEDVKVEHSNHWSQSEEDDVDNNQAHSEKQEGPDKHVELDEKDVDLDSHIDLEAVKLQIAQERHQQEDDYDCEDDEDG